MITKAFLFAGGLGTRLRPYTLDTPKPLIRLYDKPIIEYTISYLAKIGITDITINVFYLKEQFEEILNLSEKYNVKISLSRQDKLYLQGGDLSFAKVFFHSLDENESFFAINADTLIYINDLDINTAIKKVDNKNPFLVFGTNLNNNSLKIGNDNHLLGCNDFFYDDSFQSMEFYNGENTGMQIIHSSVIKYLPETPKEYSFYNREGLIKDIIFDQKNVTYYNLSNFLRFELSTAHDYETYEESEILKQIINQI